MTSIEFFWEREWEGREVLSHNTMASGWVGILFSKRFAPSSVEVKQMGEGRNLLVRAKLDHFSLIFMNIYAPNSKTERKRFSEVVELNRCSSEDYLLLGGDFNCNEKEFLDGNHAEQHSTSQHGL